MSGLKVNDIRPDAALAGQQEAMDKDIALLKSWSGNFVEVDCPACELGPRKFVYTAYGFSYQCCLACGTQYISPRPTSKMLAEFYRVSENYAYWAEHIFPPTAQIRREELFKPRARNIADICIENAIPRGTLVEVGAGYGLFCEELRKLEIFEKIIALEPSPDLAKVCLDKGIETIASPYELVSFEAPVDFIVSYEVIEHLFAPPEFVAWAYNALRPGGSILLTCPNIRGFDTILLKQDAVAVDHEHLNYFHPTSIAQLLERAGFTDIQVSTPGRLDLDLVRRAYRNELVGSEALGPFLTDIIRRCDDKIDSEFQKFLQSTGYSSNMMAIGRRPLRE
jgi:2-polyprenyl-6-hydroxyphenyl methylase/3-demethylubiquinone-9 3-methyltransferase